jgi:prepilin-type N-terminal cleavage/methylation domain-containing protein
MIIRKSRGFTLLELLIVIALIGILVSVGTASYSSAQFKARNSRRKQDMKAVQSALEQYYGVNNEYPAASNPCNLGATSATYLPAGLPIDPRPAQSYTINCIDVSNYCACGLLEGTTTEGNSSDANCSAYGSPGQYFCVKQLQ